MTNALHHLDLDDDVDHARAFPGAGRNPRPVTPRCEASVAFATARCNRPVVWVTQLAHVGGGPNTTCLTGEFTLCAAHLDSIRRAVSEALWSHNAARCESCNHPMRAVSDVVMEAVSIS